MSLAKEQIMNYDSYLKFSFIRVTSSNEDSQITKHLFKENYIEKSKHSANVMIDGKIQDQKSILRGTVVYLVGIKTFRIQITTFLPSGYVTLNKCLNSKHLCCFFCKMDY